MTIRFREKSVVAIDPTPTGIAFVFFENGDLMDAEIRSTAADSADVLATLDEILNGCAADVVILEDPDAPHSRRHPRMAEVLRCITEHVRKLGIAVFPVARQEVREAWRAKNVTTKEAIAAAIAERLPDLAPFVPARRKVGHNEDARVNLFDAASLALHVFDSFPDELAR